MEHVDVDGLRIAYRRCGAGPALVLLHGFVGDSREWRYQLDGLADAFTMIAWDAPGTGGSAPPVTSYQLGDFADRLAGLIAALALDRPHVCGLSFGGALALELYRRHPEVPRSLILADAYAGWTGSLGAAVANERLGGALRLAAGPWDQFIVTMLPQMFAASADNERAAEIAAIMAELPPPAFRAMASALAEADLRDVLPRIAVPTLVLTGDRDVRAPLAVAEALHAAIPGSELVVLAGVGHMSSVDAPDKFNAAVRAFLLKQ